VFARFFFFSHFSAYPVTIEKAKDFPEAIAM
jgi:hypothetical protein